ncbi:MAG TPA: PDZ domain-containing protein [Hanamia sp.]|nr:PDZ domain-containing protein [Hanamia sp.]
MKAKFLPAMFSVCCTMFAMNGFSQQNEPRMRKNEEIIIRKGPSDTGKTIIEIDSSQVTVNGKPLSDYNGDITITRRRNFMGGADGRDFFMQPQDFNFNNGDNNAFLGVYSAKTDKGVVINNILDGSSAQEAGLQKGDVIAKVDEKDINTPEDLRNAIQAHKPGDKVQISVLRNGKKKEIKVELGKEPSIQKELQLQRQLPNGFGNGRNFNFRMMPIPPGNFNFNFSPDRPKLGLQIQDTEDNNGVKVESVNPGSPAEKAGLKEGDIIKEMNGEKVTDVDKVMSTIQSAKPGNQYKIKVLRNKKEMTFNVKVPQQLKSTNI